MVALVDESAAKESAIKQIHQMLRDAAAKVLCAPIMVDEVGTNLIAESGHHAFLALEIEGKYYIRPDQHNLYILFVRRNGDLVAMNTLSAHAIIARVLGLVAEDRIEAALEDLHDDQQTFGKPME